MPEKEMVMKALMMVDADFDKEEFMKGNDDYGDGDHPRPPKNPFLIQSVYKSGDPHYVTTFDPNDFATQTWDQSKMDKTLTSEALAYTIQKEVEWAKDFHGEEHFWKTTDNWGAQWRFVGMMMTMNAKMQAKYLAEHMEEIKKNANTRGHFALLWALSDLAWMMLDDSFEANHTNRYKDPMAWKMFLEKADMIFENGFKMGMTPKTIQEYGVAIRWLVRYAKVTKTRQKDALQKIIDYANALTKMKWKHAWEEAYRVSWLIEARRVTWVHEDTTREASQAFLDDFDMTTKLFKNKNTYTIDEVGTIIWTLNEIKLFVVENPEQAEEVFRDFFENVVNTSGLIQSSPPLHIAKSPREYTGEPVNYFRYEDVPMPPMAGGEFGVAPVFATEVSFKNGLWKVTNANFDTAGAMHASNEMIWLHYDELNGFPELYKLTPRDILILQKWYNIVDMYIEKYPTKSKLLPAKIDSLFERIADHPKYVQIFKALKKYIEKHLY